MIGERKEEQLFRELEQQTNHQQLMTMTERIAKSGWLVLVIALVFFVISGETAMAYAFLLGGLGLLGTSFFLGIQADRIRRQIQAEVDKQMGRQ